MGQPVIMVRVGQARPDRQVLPPPDTSLEMVEPDLPQKKRRVSRKTFMNHVREILMEPSRLPDGSYNTRLEDAANAFVQFMERGSFVHTKEFVDREEGKVPARIADAEGKNIKLYIGMPTDDTDPMTP